MKLLIKDGKSQIIAPVNVIEGIKEILRVENDFMTRKRSNFKVPKYNYMIKDSGEFYTGHLDIVTMFLKDKRLKFEVEDIRNVKDCPDVDTVLARISNLKFCNPPIKLRDYQMEALIKGLERTMGLFHIATGGGKTLVMSALIMAWGLKTLILVDSKDLARQLIDELSFFTGQPVGMIGDGSFSPQWITVGMVQTLTARKSGKQAKPFKDFMLSVEYIVCDEAHHTQSITWRKVLNACSNASVRHGFTATPLTSKVKNQDGGFSNLNMILSGFLGPIIFKMSTVDLIDSGWLSRPEVKLIKNTLYFDGEVLTYTEEYDRIISKDDQRNNIISSIFLSAYNNGQQAIGFVSRIEHGELIAEKLINEYGIPASDIGFVHGSVFHQARKDMINDFKDGGLKILFGTVLNEGLNFFCDVGINMAGGDSDKLTIQRLGRILRKKRTNSGDVDKEDVASVTFYDFADKGHPFFSKHGRNRKKLYLAEGHKVTEVSADEFIEVEDDKA
jgi:superfamily II DNA or RNA helicase